MPLGYRGHPEWLTQARNLERQERRLRLLLTLRMAAAEVGRWPTAGEWERATPTHAARRTYLRYFGSSEEAC